MSAPARVPSSSRYVSALFLLLVISTVSRAQLTTGTITGSVQDQSGAAVPGANIAVRMVETGTVRATVSNPGGRYEVPNLQPGLYDVTVTANGFQTSVRSGIDLSR
jgi:hypothetical protein